MVMWGCLSPERGPHAPGPLREAWGRRGEWTVGGEVIARLGRGCREEAHGHLLLGVPSAPQCTGGSWMWPSRGPVSGGGRSLTETSVHAHGAWTFWARLRASGRKKHV